MAGWHVIQKGFSAVTIGIGFQSDRIGWTSYTDGSSMPKIVKTEDGGQSWNPIQNTTGLNFITMGVSAAKGYWTNVATSGALESDLWSTDGERFVQSVGAPIVSQDIKHEAGRIIMAGPKGPCISTTGGAVYKCITNVPLNNPGTGRYASCPSKDVCYFTAGQWPSDNPSTQYSRGDSKVFKVSHQLRVIQAADGSVKHELGPEILNGDNVTGYTGELWKTTDGGATWTNLINDEGNFYFNDIHCSDEKTCVAVAEGFAQDGSGAPGARVYLTTDGSTFNLVHQETQGTESLMTARMISNTEYWAGGSVKPGGFYSPALILHSQDAGQTHLDESNGIKGQMITSWDFVSGDHAYATSITALQVCNLLELNGSNPPAPTPTPTPGAGHYEKPPCADDEAEASVTGADGKLCAPPCTSAGQCPTDVPEGVTAQPMCALKDQSGNQYCALLCQSDDQCDAAGGAKCSSVGQGAGVCTYPGTSAKFLSQELRLMV